MQKLFLLLAMSFIGHLAHSQFDPIFYGNYYDGEMKTGFIVYSMDEVDEECFIVEYEQYEDLEIMDSEPGFGDCSLENGNFKLSLESYEKDLLVKFKVEEDGTKSMSVQFPDGQKVEYIEMVFDEAYEENNDEVFYSREDGTELTLYPLDDDESIGFSILGMSDDLYLENQVSGEIRALNEEMTKFESTLEKGCKLIFEVGDGSITIKEQNCSSLHTTIKADWNGQYFLIE